jgi:hypothetical protein
MNQDLPELNDMSDEESDNEHDENEKNEFEDIEEVALFFLNPFGTLRIECIYLFALHHEIFQQGKWHSHYML